MPQYELSLILRTLARPELVQAVKRTSQYIIEKGGIIRSFESVGHRRLPYKISKEKMRYSEGVYFLVNFHSPISVLEGLRETMDRDPDILRPAILRKEMELGRPCEKEPCFFGELNEEVRKKAYMDLKTYVKKL